MCDLVPSLVDCLLGVIDISYFVAEVAVFGHLAWFRNRCHIDSEQLMTCVFHTAPKQAYQLIEK